MEFQTSARLDIFCKIVNDTFCTSKAGRKRSYVPKRRRAAIYVREQIKRHKFLIEF